MSYAIKRPHVGPKTSGVILLYGKIPILLEQSDQSVFLPSDQSVFYQDCQSQVTIRAGTETFSYQSYQYEIQ